MSIFYVIFILLTIYYSFRYDGIEEHDSHKEHRLWLMCCYLICLSGFSYGIGGDKFIYMQEFEQYPTSFSESFDFIWLNFMLNAQMPLWTLTNLFSKVCFNSFYAVQIIQSIAINTAVCYFVSKYTKRYFLFLLIYFLSLQYFILNTEVMREGFAIAASLVGIHAYLSGKKYVLYLSLIIGLLFHFSAIVILAFPFSFFRINWRTLAYAFTVAFIIWLVSDIVLGKVILSVLGGRGAIVEKVMLYALKASTIFGFLRNAVTYLILPFIVMYFPVSTEENDDLRKRKQQLTAFMVLLALIASSVAGLIRFYNYAIIPYLILLADFSFTLFHTKRHLILRAGTLAGTIILIMLNYHIVQYKSTGKYFYEFYYPYTCILDEDKSVFIREITHYESANTGVEDNNVRELK